MGTQASGLAHDSISLWYAETYSLVAFIADAYGEEKLGEVVLTLADNHPMEETLQLTLGMDLIQFEMAWREWLGYPVDALPTPMMLAPVTITPIPLPARPRGGGSRHRDAGAGPPYRSAAYAYPFLGQRVPLAPLLCFFQHIAAGDIHLDACPPAPVGGRDVASLAMCLDCRYRSDFIAHGLRPADCNRHRDDATGDGRGHSHARSVTYSPAAGAERAHRLPGRRTRHAVSLWWLTFGGHPARDGSALRWPCGLS